ncbi:hypothetical protein PLICRDRAFT_175556 [Plicaturopsis crispa FD-325 SS-3]|nr:hypothetical protein PLICRDRAFT_175556 [Plicaturopsis crispa FD-325 SS-3]
MKSTFFAAALAVFLLPAFAVADQISWDGTYDVASTSLDTVACSDGSHGLESKYHTFGGLPSDPYIGGAAAIGGWNSASCGTCWKLVHERQREPDEHQCAGNRPCRGWVQLVTGGDECIDEWAGRRRGIVQADVAQVDKSVCGL